MKETINKIFKPFYQSIPSEKRGLLIMDNVRAHYDHEKGEIKKLLKNNLRVDIFLLPPNSSSYL